MLAFLCLSDTVSRAASAQAVIGNAQTTADRYEQDRLRKLERDRKFRKFTDGPISMKKTSYSSVVDGLEIPVYLFEPLRPRGTRGHAALLWIHGRVHGDLDPFYCPFIKEAVDRGYIVVAPEHRGSTGYGRTHQEAIDYGGYEVYDCLTAVRHITTNLLSIPSESGPSGGVPAASSRSTRCSVITRLSKQQLRSSP